MCDKAYNVFTEYINEVNKVNAQCTGVESLKPNASDIFITTFAKSGTTLLQQLVYQLKVITGNVPTDPTGTDFEDISQVIPMVSVAPLTGVYESIHPYTPRAWKVHSSERCFPYDRSIGKWINCVRNGLQVAPSYLDFTLDWAMKERVADELRPGVFYHSLMAHFLGLERQKDGTYKRNGNALGRWFEHVRDWLYSDRENILYLVYEEIIADVEGTVRRVAKFLEIEVDDEQVREVARRCDREYMAGKFIAILFSRATGWDVRLGHTARPLYTDGFKNFELPQDFRDIYNDMFFEAFGVREYSDLIRLIHKRSSED